MKPLILSLAMMMGLSGLVQAEDLEATKVETTIKANHHNAQEMSLSSKRKPPVKPVDPQETGVLKAVADRGWVMFSPLAPSKEGDGSQFLVENAFPNAHAASRATGNPTEFSGIKLFGWDF